MAEAPFADAPAPDSARNQENRPESYTSIRAAKQLPDGKGARPKLGPVWMEYQLVRNQMSEHSEPSPTEGNMKKLKLATAALALSISATASAMPPQVPDRYYDHFWGFLFGIVSAHRPCGPQGGWCNPNL